MLAWMIFFRYSAVVKFPFGFGFIPSTLGEDGDPLDILVLMDTPARRRPSTRWKTSLSPTSRIALRYHGTL